MSSNLLFFISFYSYIYIFFISLEKYSSVSENVLMLIYFQGRNFKKIFHEVCVWKKT